MAQPTTRRVLAERAAAILRVAHQKRALVRVPAPVLAEVCRGVRHDSAINQLLNNPGVRVVELDRATAQQAGQMLARLKLSSAHAIDAFLVATALQFDTAVIATDARCPGWASTVAAMIKLVSRNSGSPMASAAIISIQVLASEAPPTHATPPVSFGTMNPRGALDALRRAESARTFARSSRVRVASSRASCSSCSPLRDAMEEG
jgi:predicted nucleic acid-binding protein